MSAAIATTAKIKQRTAANSFDTVTSTPNERILKECHLLYTDTENGLIKIADNLGLKLLPPRKKVTVLLIGNHSAGKSSFINWYVEEHIQKTGVAIETQGFVFVTSGKKRESLTGNATLHLYPHFRPLQKIKGVVDYLTTEISTSRQKKFNLVTFVDSPGLVDGDMNYPFDVNQSILWLGDLADLIFVFFDPIGQALCKRTVNIVEKLSQKHSDRIRFYLSKADEAGHESDRQRVMMQIVQELCKRPGLNKTCFNMPTIYIPTYNKSGSRCLNQIDEVCKDIEKTINQTIQNTLNALEKDCEKIAKVVDDKITFDIHARSNNWSSAGRGILYAGLGVALPVLLLINSILEYLPKLNINSIFGLNVERAFDVLRFPVRLIWAMVPDDYHFWTVVFILLFSYLLILMAKWQIRMKPTLSRKQKKNLLEDREYVQNYVKSKKQQLYEEYLSQSISESDL